MELALIAIAAVMLAGGQKPPPPPPPAPKQPAREPDYLDECLRGGARGAAVGTAFNPGIGTGIGALSGCALYAGREWVDENWDDVKGWWRDLWD